MEQRLSVPRPVKNHECAYNRLFFVIRALGFREAVLQVRDVFVDVVNALLELCQLPLGLTLILRLLEQDLPVEFFTYEFALRHTCSEGTILLPHQHNVIDDGLALTDVHTAFADDGGKVAFQKVCVRAVVIAVELAGKTFDPHSEITHRSCSLVDFSSVTKPIILEPRAVAKEDEEPKGIQHTKSQSPILHPRPTANSRRVRIDPIGNPPVTQRLCGGAVNVILAASSKVADGRHGDKRVDCAEHRGAGRQDQVAHETGCHLRYR
mmetsp:Transcript_16220/g.44436  ORF Transcript_16220/g.44436 Transcript_16220/m.44436 type:complete len:265 (+) Transcript_16220:1089-1883(+)